MHSLTRNVRNMLMDMDQEIFQECQRKYHEEETKVICIQEKHEITWQRLEAVASSKAVRTKLVSVAL